MAPSGLPFPEALDTRHVDAGMIGRVALDPATSVNVRASTMATWQDHTFGAAMEHDRRTTSFGEASLSLSRSRHSLVLGVSAEHDGLRTRPSSGFGYGSTLASIFGEDTYTPDEIFSLATSVRLDHQSGQGSFFSPRLSVLAHLPDGWDARASAARPRRWGPPASHR